MYVYRSTRALPDVEAMVRVFTHQSLVKCLSHLPICSPKKQVTLWIEQKRLHQRTSTLISSLGGKPAVTSTQAKRLDSLGVSFESIVELHSQCGDDAIFCKTLKDRGVKSKRSCWSASTLTSSMPSFLLPTLQPAVQQHLLVSASLHACCEGPKTGSFQSHHPTKDSPALS